MAHENAQSATIWAAFEPSAERPWDLRRCGHLLRRAGFGGTWMELQRALKAGPRRAVESLLDPQADDSAHYASRRQDEAAAAQSGSTASLEAWWLRGMIESPHPLLEKMTLFWSGYFAASTPHAALMHRRLVLLRREALGDFAELLRGIARDEATRLAFGAEASRRAAPDQRFPRQLLSRFTVGPGNHSEADIESAARAFSGWFVRRNRLRFYAHEHDVGEKTVLGRRGNLDGDDVVTAALEHPATALHVVRQVYRCLVSETDRPNDASLAPLAESFRGDYNISRLVKTILLSNVFHGDSAYRRRVKSPIEFAVGMIRSLEGQVPTIRLARDLASIGQRLSQPPTEKGWIGGLHWLDAAAMIGRVKLSRALTAGHGPYAKKLNPMSVAEEHDHRGAVAASRFFVQLFLQDDVPQSLVEAAARSAKTENGLEQQARIFTSVLAAAPEYQLA